MRCASFIAVVLLTAACSRESAFDDRYQAAETKLREQAAEIDAEIAKRAKTEGDAQAGEADVPPLPPGH